MIKDTGSVLSPENVKIVVFYDSFCFAKVKPTAYGSPEGSRHEFDMARIHVTTGVLDQGMYLRG